MDFGYLFTSFDGRINRKPYWMGVLVLFGAAIVISLVFAFLLGAVQSQMLMIGSFLIQLALLYPSAALMAKRLHDRNRPTWWVAFMLVPIVLQGLAGALGLTNPLNPTTLDHLLNLVVFVIAIWFFIELGILRGTSGPNEYGPDPLEGQY